jgi:hypothetical protein
MSKSEGNPKRGEKWEINHLAGGSLLRTITPEMFISSVASWINVERIFSGHCRI